MLRVPPSTAFPPTCFSVHRCVHAQPVVHTQARMDADAQHHARETAAASVWEAVSTAPANGGSAFALYQSPGAQHAGKESSCTALEPVLPCRWCLQDASSTPTAAGPLTHLARGRAEPVSLLASAASTAATVLACRGVPCSSTETPASSVRGPGLVCCTHPQPCWAPNSLQLCGLQTWRPCEAAGRPGPFDCGILAMPDCRNGGVGCWSACRPPQRGPRCGKGAA